ncbi:hypothetical protein D3C81_2018110 [compost metagenome]
MTNLMGNHIGLRKIAGDAETIAHGLEEFQVNINLLVTRAVKRSCCGIAGTASGWRLAGKQY